MYIPNANRKAAPVQFALHDQFDWPNLTNQTSNRLAKPTA